VSLLPATLRFPPQWRGTPTLLRPKEEAPEWEPRVLAKHNWSPRMSTFERTKGNNPERVDVLMRPEVMGFHVMPMACFFYAW